MKPQRKRYPTMREAYDNRKDGRAICCSDGNFVVSSRHAERLARAGAQFAYICMHKGKLVTIPVN